MAVPKKIVYAGETFWLQTSGRYYQSGRHNAPERLLHRRIYADVYGPIPEGYEVHHRNDDWQNNALDNLELKPKAEHAREHCQARWDDAEARIPFVEGLALAREAAKGWHASEAGRAWHAEHSRKTWEDRTLTDVQCVVCGTTFGTVFPSRTKFCSDACYYSQSYRRHKTASGICLHCGNPFVYNKYRQQTCCSRACAIRYRLGKPLSLPPDA